MKDSLVVQCCTNSDPALSQSRHTTSLFQLPPILQRPSTSHARIEGGKHDQPSSTFPSLPFSDDRFQPAFLKKSSDSDQKLWAGQANIVVTVRLRPLLTHDRDRVAIVQVVENKELVVWQPSVRLAARRPGLDPFPPRHASRSVPNCRHDGPSRRAKRYAFDRVFDALASQQEVYEHTTKGLIYGLLHGFNATVFTYGSTGAGKTYTMLGTSTDPGIMARTLEDLFQQMDHVQDEARRYRIRVSFLEIYNENIRDLLATTSSSSSTVPSSEYLDLREDPVRGMSVAGLLEVEAKDAHDVMKLLRRGNRVRSQESTAANAVSSRSHAVLQVHIEQLECVTDSMGDNTIVVKNAGKLSLVDLAGSERAAVTQNRGQRLLEGANINRSLLALGNCINALGANGGSFVPYRDSKLTRLLKDSLGGNCRTVMIANVSLAASSVEETLNTLKYANRAKNIKTTVARNLVHAEATSDQSDLVATLRDEIATLKQELSRHEQANRTRGKEKARWLLNKQSIDGCNLDFKEDKRLRTRKLLEARQYITRSFQQQQRLRCALLGLEHQIKCQSQNLNALHALDSATSVDEEVQIQEDPKILNDNSSTISLVFPSILKAEGKDSCNEHLALLMVKKEKVVQQLARNEQALNKFRLEIEQNPVLEQYELVREVLLMEYRIGNLEMDKLVLETDFQLNNKMDAAELQQHNRDHSVETWDVRLSPNDAFDPPNLDALDICTDDHKHYLPKIIPTKGGLPGRGKFLNELRDHLYPTLSARTRYKQESTAGSPNKVWNFHLHNASLSRLRLKKKKPVPLYVEPLQSESVADGKST